MQPGARRRARINGGVVGGSIWETRMKMDQVKGGIKVFNAENEINADEEGIRVYNRRLRRNLSENINISTSASSVERRKRRNWKPPEPVANGVLDKSPVQLRKAKSELSSSPKICNGEQEEEEEEEEEDEIEIEVAQMKMFDDKEIDLPKDVEEDNKKKEVSISPEIEMEHDLDPVIDLKKMEPDLDPVRPQTVEVEEEMVEIRSETQNRMQNIVDLVMWRDISKSAFVFGFGTFILLSSSYTKDIDFSLISAISYLGLLYLALIFLYKSILIRGTMEFDEREEKCIIGEDEAIWALRFLLPYINEVLLKIKALFSGDPAITMKLAVLLFVMARCGSSITLWALAKLVFFGLFTIPKIISSYYVQLARYGKFWMERFRDGWESCTHKKAVIVATFTLIWNISSMVARIWAVFMLVVAVKLYQQCAVEWNNAEEEQESIEEDTREVDEKRQEDSRAELSPAAGNKCNNRIQVHHRQSYGSITRSSTAAAAAAVRKDKEMIVTKIKKRT